MRSKGETAPESIEMCSLRVGVVAEESRRRLDRLVVHRGGLRQYSFRDDCDGAEERSVCTDELSRAC